MKKLDLTNMQFGRLTAIKTDGKTKNNMSKWLCRCECGNITSVSIGHLRNGETKSCGCISKEILSTRNTTHGDASNGKYAPEYRAWRHMINRCYNKNVDMYYNYGGRGIIVCERWLTSYEHFLNDMGRRPTLRHSLDRYPNTDGNYEPGNCRWATTLEQSSNKRNNKWIEYNGERMIQAEWARKLKTDVRLLYSRLKRMSFADMVKKFY